MSTAKTPKSLTPRAANILRKYGLMDRLKASDFVGWRTMLNRSLRLGNHKYLDWIIKNQAASKSDLREYLISWCEWVDRNQRIIKQHGLSTDIYAYTVSTIGQTFKHLVDDQGTGNTRESSREFVVLGKAKGWTAYAPFNHTTAVYLGNRYVPEVPVRWCVAANSDQGRITFHSYYRDGGLVVFVNPSAKKKYALYAEIYDDRPVYHLFDAEDHSLSTKPDDLPESLVLEAVEYGARRVSHAHKQRVPTRMFRLIKTDAAHPDEGQEQGVVLPELDDVEREVDFSEIEDEELFLEE